MGLKYFSSEARQYYSGRIGSPSSPETRPVRTLGRAEPFFDEPVCVLTGPVTFSWPPTSPMRSTIVAEETGGRPNDFGNLMPFTMPNSGLTAYRGNCSFPRYRGT